MARDRKRAKQRQRRAARRPEPPRTGRAGGRADDEPTPDGVAESAGLPAEEEGDAGLPDREEDFGLPGADKVSGHDTGPDDAEPADGLPTDAPDPIAHASAEVELAEATARGEAMTGEPPADDAAPGARRNRERQPELGGAAEPSTAKRGNRFFVFVGHCWDELKRVQWPDRRQVAQATGVVLGFVVLAGGYLGLMDAIFSRLVNLII